MRAVTLGCFGGDCFDYARREKRIEQRISGLVVEQVPVVQEPSRQKIFEN